MKKIVVHTIDARNNVMLEVIRDYFRVEPHRMMMEIQEALAQTTDILLRKGIEYNNLKTALVPNAKRREVAFVFDTTRIEDSWYGLPIHNKLMHLFSKESNHSVLEGDYLGENERQERLFREMVQNLHLASDVEYRHSTQFYFVYINNLTDHMVKTFHAGLSRYSPYVGCVDLTFSSFLKTYLSTILVNCFIKHRQYIIMGHEDDRDNEQDVNMMGYPFEDYDLKCRSLQSLLFELLLSYKIERPVFRGFETDTEFSINAVNPSPIPLSELNVQVDVSKFEYLLEKKRDSMKRIGLLDCTHHVLENVIREKLYSNYIYNICYDDKHETTKFNILMEVQPCDAYAPFRVVVALKYIPKERCVRLITLY